MLDEIWLSVQGNMTMLRERTTIYSELALNLLTGLIGVGIWWMFDGLGAWAGVILAVMGFGAIVKWVMGL